MSAAASGAAQEVVAKCAVCNVTRKELSKCGACKITLYCSKEHQVAHWPEHKAECKAIRKRAAQHSEENAAVSASETRKLMEFLSEQREQRPKLYKTMAIFDKDKSRPGTLVGLGVPLEIFASEKGHKKRHTQKEKDDEQVETIMSALRVMPLRVCSQALMMLRMSTKQKITENFTRLDLDEMKASAIEKTASYCANFLACREAAEEEIVSSTDPEVEGTQDAWPDVIEWKPGYGAANLPPPRSRPDSTFPLQQRVSRRHCIHVLGCPVMTPKKSDMIRCEGVEDGEEEDGDHGCEVYYYHSTVWNEVTSIMCPGDVLLLYPGVYPREIWGEALTCPVEVIGVNGPRDKIVLEMKEDEADWFLRLSPRSEHQGLYYRFANLTMRGKTWESVVDVLAGFMGEMTPIDLDAPPAHVELVNCLIKNGENGVNVRHGGRLHMLGCKLDGGNGFGVNVADGAEARLIDTTITNTGSGDMSIKVYRGSDAAIQVDRGGKVRVVRCRLVKNHGHAVQGARPKSLEHDRKELLTTTLSELGISGSTIDRAVHTDAPPPECVFEDCEVSGNGQCTAACPSSLQIGPCPWHLETTKLGRRLREDEMREERNRVLHGNIYGEKGGKW